MKVKKAEPTPFVLGILFIICSIIFLSDGIERQSEYTKIKDSLISIPAIVSEISVLEDSDGMDSYTACVTYTYEAKTYRDKGWKGMSKGEYGVGQKVNITINPDSPDMPYTYSGSIAGHIGGAVIFFVIGCGFVVFSFRLKKEQYR